MLHKEPSGEKQNTLIRYFNSAPIKKVYGMTLSYSSSNEAVFDLPYNPNFDHALDAIHGGVVLTLLDNAGWFTVAQFYDVWISTADLHAQFLEPVAQTHLQGVGHVTRVGKRLAHATMDIKTPEGKLVARGSGTFAVSSLQLPPFKGR